jgi:hypothetical protein
MVVCMIGWSSEAKGNKTIAVRILVDEEEPRTARLWQETLGRRLDQASTILSRYSSIRFSVTKFSTWDSDDSEENFARSLAEFEKEADPAPAELAIGFTSQYRLRPGVSNLGGTRGPMRKHILIREGSPKTQEIERLEVLIHELSHYLGAAHSGLPDSVMRPVLGDGQSRARAFQIKLDENNAKIVRLVSHEMASLHITSMHRLTIGTRMELQKLYVRLAREFPEDEVAGKYAVLMDKSIRFSMAARQKQLEAARLKSSTSQQQSFKSNLSQRQNSPRNE